MDSSQRLLLQALLTGMGDAVRRNDASAADRYHRRLALIAPHFATNPSVSEALERLHSAGARWLATDAAEHYAAEQQVLEDIQRVMDFI
jgi:DNA-binding GntR family transcriptional regulator